MSASPWSLGRLARMGFGPLRPSQLFDAWRSAETDASLALTVWRSARSEDKADAYAAYLAALDREAQAAETLQLGLAPAGT
jgi:hypothetical protein